MKAMILAADRGTRLRFLTNERPKALVELNGRALLEITITRLASFGVREVIVNVHHFADQVVSYLKSKNNFGLRLEISREDDLLLDTGGGLKKAAWFFLDEANHVNEPFLLHNVDVISNIDLRQMLRVHKENKALATLAVQSRESSRQLLFNEKLQLVGRRIRNQDTLIPSVRDPAILSEGKNPGTPSTESSRHETAGSPNVSHPEHSEAHAVSAHSPLATRHSSLPFAFSGIHVLSTRLLPLLTESQAVFSIIDSYLSLASQGHKILAFRADQYYWRDLGRPSDLAQASLDLQQKAVVL